MFRFHFFVWLLVVGFSVFACFFCLGWVFFLCVCLWLLPGFSALRQWNIIIHVHYEHWKLTTALASLAIISTASKHLHNDLAKAIEALEQKKTCCTQQRTEHCLQMGREVKTALGALGLPRQKGENYAEAWPPASTRRTLGRYPFHTTSPRSNQGEWINSPSNVRTETIHFHQECTA